jgi:hypothetical protein
VETVAKDAIRGGGGRGVDKLLDVFRQSAGGRVRVSGVGNKPTLSRNAGSSVLIKFDVVRTMT